MSRKTTEGLKPDQPIISLMESHEYGDVHICVDPSVSLTAIIAIHSTKLGPALGGCRFYPYESSNAAILDALRLGRGMTYKAAISGLDLGGGKAVIIAPKGEFDRVALFRRFGRFVDSLGGRYITAEDSGTRVSDMETIRQETQHVTGIPKEGYSFDDPSPMTAWGIFNGIQAAVRFKLDRNDLKGTHVAIQGVGSVGYNLARYLSEEGVKLTVADVNDELVERAVAEFGAEKTTVADIHKIPCDVFAPCALGAVINDNSLNELNTTIVAGAANNQLAHPKHGKQLHDNHILYAPDYVINAGGLIYVSAQHHHESDQQAQSRVAQLGDTLTEIFERSKREDRPTHEVADAIAEERLN